MCVQNPCNGGSSAGTTIDGIDLVLMVFEAQSEVLAAGSDVVLDAGVDVVFGACVVFDACVAVGTDVGVVFGASFGIGLEMRPAKATRTFSLMLAMLFGGIGSGCHLTIWPELTAGFFVERCSSLPLEILPMFLGGIGSGCHLIIWRELTDVVFAERCGSLPFERGTVSTGRGTASISTCSSMLSVS